MEEENGTRKLPIRSLAMAFLALLIIVGVALDTLQQLESQLMTRHYEGFMKKGRLQGRR